jgi:hypothetical protein
MKESFYEELERVFDKFPKYNMNTLIGYFDAKVNREDLLKPIIGNGSLHEISNDNRIRVLNISISKNLSVKSTTFPQHNIHKFNWTSPDGKTHNQIDHIMIDRRQHANVFHVR